MHVMASSNLAKLRDSLVKMVMFAICRSQATHSELLDGDRYSYHGYAVCEVRIEFDFVNTCTNVAIFSSHGPGWTCIGHLSRMMSGGPN